MNIYFFKISIFYLFVFLDWTLGCEPLKSIFNYYSHKYQTGKQENSGRNFCYILTRLTLNLEINY